MGNKLRMYKEYDYCKLGERLFEFGMISIFVILLIVRLLNATKPMEPEYFYIFWHA